MYLLPQDPESKTFTSSCLQQQKIRRKQKDSYIRHEQIILLIGACVHAGLVAQSCLILVTPLTVAGQALLFMGFSWQEYWSVLPLPPGDLPDPEIKPVISCISCIAGRTTGEAPN